MLDVPEPGRLPESDKFSAGWENNNEVDGGDVACTLNGSGEVAKSTLGCTPVSKGGGLAFVTKFGVGRGLEILEYELGVRDPAFWESGLS